MGLSSGQNSRRMSVQSQISLHGSPRIAFGRSKTNTDPNVVILDRFDDVTSPSAMPFPNATSARSQSIPSGFQGLSITPSSPNMSIAVRALPESHITSSDDLLVRHFRRHIIHRLILPLMAGDHVGRQQPLLLKPGSTEDVFQLEAVRFLPLHHAICAISALNLSYGGQVSLEEAMQHYHQAISSTATPTTADDLLSDGVFLRHFLLFVYDICVPLVEDDTMWALHLNHLRQIAVQRNERLGREPHAYILWRICQLDVEACLLGSGSCEFFGTLLDHDMLPSLEQLIPITDPNSPEPFLQTEAIFFPQVLRLSQGVLVITAKLARLAQKCRTQVSSQSTAPPAVLAGWQASVSQMQIELLNFWTEYYPDFLPQDSPQAACQLPNRVRQVFEQAYLLYQTATVYSRTSMFPSQRTIPIAQQANIHADTEHRCRSIIALAEFYLESNTLEHRHVVFPLLIAGVATVQSDLKVRAIELMKAFQRHGGIGQNTYRTRQLLQEVCEEQRAVVTRGGRTEQVDWLTIAKERSLTVVNAGL